MGPGAAQRHTSLQLSLSPPASTPATAATARIPGANSPRRAYRRSTTTPPGGAGGRRPPGATSAVNINININYYFYGRHGGAASGGGPGEHAQPWRGAPEHVEDQGHPGEVGLRVTTPSSVITTPPTATRHTPMTDSNRNPQSYPPPGCTTLLTPSSPVTIWNRQLDQLQCESTLTPGTPVSGGGGGACTGDRSPSSGEREGDTGGGAESNSSGESTPVAASPDGGDGEEEEDTPTVSLSWDSPWSPVTLGDVTGVTDTTKCLEHLHPGPGYTDPNNPAKEDTPGGLDDPHLALRAAARLEELANRNVKVSPDGGPVLARSSSAALELMTAALPSLTRCRITRNPLTTGPLRGGDGYYLPARPLPRGRSAWSVPATPCGKHRAHPAPPAAHPALDNLLPPHRVLPYLLSPLSPCRDPFLYLKVFEAVAKCTETLAIRSDDSSSDSDSDSSSSDSDTDSSSSSSGSGSDSSSGSGSSSSSSSTSSSSDSSSDSDKEGLAVSAQPGKKKKKAKSKKKH